MVYSFDLFDTLVFRACKEPHAIFQQMQDTYHLKDFVKHRIQCEKDTLGDTYHELASIYKWGEKEQESYQQSELQLELHNLYPNRHCTEQITPHDIIVSDTYLDHVFLTQLLKKFNIHYKHLYSSPHGKTKKTIWKTIQEDGFTIDRHFGDNPYTDKQSPMSFGIPATLITDSDFTTREQLHHRSLALLQRFLRLQLPEHSSFVQNIYQEQIYVNIPFLIYFSHLIHSFTMQHNIETILFSMRDTFFLYHIYKTLYPHQMCHLLLCSRQVYNNPSQHYCNYFASLHHNKTLVIDIHGTGASLHRFLSTNFPSSDIQGLYFFQSSNTRLPRISAIQYNTSNEVYEIMNYIDCGSLHDYDESGPCFHDLEYPNYIPNIIQKPIALCIQYLKVFRPQILIQSKDIDLHYSNPLYKTLHHTFHKPNTTPYNFIANYQHLLNFPYNETTFYSTRVYILHQNDKTDRRAHLQTLLHQLRLDNIQWVEPKVINSTDPHPSTISPSQLSHLLTYISILEAHNPLEPCLILEDDLSPIYPPDLCHTIMSSFHDHITLNNHYLKIDLFYWEFCYAKCKGFNDIYNNVRGVPFYCTAAIYFPAGKTQTVLSRIQEFITTTKTMYATDEILYQIIQKGGLHASCHIPLFQQDVSRFGSYIQGSSTFQRRPCIDDHQNRFEKLLIQSEKEDTPTPSYGKIFVCVLFILIVVFVIWKMVYNG